MFGFIKMLGRFMSNLRKNKRLWFTTLFVISTVGIFLATFLLISTTSRVSKSVYESETKTYELRLESLIKSTENKLHQISIAFLENKELLQAFDNNDTKVLKELENSFNLRDENTIKDALKIKLHLARTENKILQSNVISSIQTQNNIFGVEVVQDGVFFVFLYPILKDEEVLGVLEVKESIYIHKKNFEKTNQDYIFLLHNKMLPLLSLQNRDGVFYNVGKNHLVNNKIYSSKTLGYLDKLNNTDINKLISGDYIITQEMFLNGVVMQDTNGVDIGLIVMGENKNKDDGFIHMSKKMTNQVVMIVLGLIVALLLFLF